MTEPVEVADAFEPVAGGVVHWRISNSRIGGAISSSHAVPAGEASVLVDPVRLADGPLSALPRPAAAVLTATCHQRAAWRYRRELGIEVWLPEDARDGDEQPDRRYAEGEVLPGGLRALRTPGPERPHYSLLLEGEPGILFCSDLVQNDGGSELTFVPPEYHEDPAETRRSVERLLELDFTILCLAHGTPLVDEPRQALRRLLERA
jgi:glyoxylase-like metal-dependent hydrolase (beta-lactamase superfamily II)